MNKDKTMKNLFKFLKNNNIEIYINTSGDIMVHDLDDHLLDKDDVNLGNWIDSNESQSGLKYERSKPDYF